MDKQKKSNLVSFDFEISETHQSHEEGAFSKIFDRVLHNHKRQQLTEQQLNDSLHETINLNKHLATTNSSCSSSTKESIISSFSVHLDSTAAVVPRSSSSTTATTATTVTVGNSKFELKDQPLKEPAQVTVQSLTPTLPKSQDQEALDFLLPMPKRQSFDSDTQSIVTNFSISNSNSLSKILARLRGQRNDEEFWMPDEQCRECYKCRKPFTFLRRKHHCRTCGQIFCGKCASHIISGKVFKQKGHVRVCNFCYAEHQLNENSTSALAIPKMATPTMKSEYIMASSPLSKHTEVNDDDPSINNSYSSPIIPSQQKPPLVAPKMQIPTTALKQARGHYGNVDTTTFAFEIPSPNDTERPLDATDYSPTIPTITTTGASNNDLPLNGNSGLKRLLDAGTSLLIKSSRPRSNTSSSAPLFDDRSHLSSSSILDCGGGTVVAESELSPFSSNSTNSHAAANSYSAEFYQDQLRHHPSTSPKLPQYGSDDELYDRRTKRPEELRGHEGSKRKVKIQINTIGLPKSFQPDYDWSPNPFLSPFLIDDNNKFSPSYGNNTENRSFRFPPLSRQRRQSGPQPMVELSFSARTHARNILRQLMRDIPILALESHSEWEDVIMELLLKTTNNVRPDIRAGDDMDVRHYVKIKKIPGGLPNDSFYVRGVMCTKNIAHKRMAIHLRNPKILILMFSLDYSRVEMENQLLSIEPVISQEREHIRKLVARIVALRPSLIVVKSTVSRLALEFLLEAQIPVIHNVKQSVIEAVARCTQASIVTSVDKLQQATMGRCGSFEIKTIMHEWIVNRRKTYLVFDDCAPELGGTIVLRGARVEVLRVIKRLLDFMVFVVNNLKLETSLLLDSFAKSQNEPLSRSSLSSNDKDSSNYIDNLLQLYGTRILSVSQFVVYPPPYLLVKLKETEDQLAMIRKQRQSKMIEVSPTRSVFEKQQHQIDLEMTMDAEHELILKNHRIARAWEVYMGENPESVSPFYHQNIVVLYSSVCTVTTVPCQGPEIRIFSYYRFPSDKTLGQYLIDLFNDARQTCSSFMCDHSMMQHYRSYAHGTARVIVMIEPFACPLPGMSDKLLMWSYCKLCNKYTPVMPMSENTWNYSFGKFLEIFLYQRGVRCRADICPHDIAQTHVRFFGYNDLAIHFQYDSIDLLEVSPPPMKLFIHHQAQMDLKETELKSLRSKINKFYQSIMDRNKNFPFDLVDPRRLESCKIELQEMSMEAEGERKEVLQSLQNIYATSDPLDTLTIQIIQRDLFQFVTHWESVYTDFVQYYLKPERELKKLTTIQLKKMFPGDEAMVQPMIMASDIIDLPLLGQDLVEDNNDNEDKSTEFSMMPTLSSSPSLKDKEQPSCLQFEIRHRLSLELMRELNSKTTQKSPRLSASFSPRRFCKGDLPLLLSNEKPKQTKHQRHYSLGQQDWKSDKQLISSRDRLPRKNTYIQVYTQANDLVQEEEMDEFMDDDVFSRRRHIELSKFHSDNDLSPAEENIDYFSNLAPYSLEVMKPYTKQVSSPQEIRPFSDGLDLSSGVSGDEIDEDLPRASELLKTQPLANIHPDLLIDSVTSKGSKTVHLDDTRHSSIEKISFMKTLTNFLTDSGVGNLLPLELPLQSTEYLFPDSYVVVREDEPSTIIAYTLSSEDYIDKMCDIHNTAESSIKAASSSELKLDNMDDIQETLLRESGTHMRYNFSTGSTKFFCKIFFSEQFDALRRNCGCHESYIMSLANCVKWDSLGGKSGSAFLKTKDDRLLMKQMSKYELDAFLRFAPAYFQYMSEAFFSDLPTVLAKIFGFYSIGYKNGATGKSMRMDVLVMENLFYQRKIKKIFDLKGSMRNRHVQSTGKQDEVLLDENLVELIYQSPLFIRAHSKEILRSSLHNDTLFLSTRNVMDYSLLVGIDEEHRELVVGIVDFIRTFTWDKKLESWVKESGILGGGGKEPTIVSPRQYRIRFREAMERYFLMVPDFWALSRQVNNNERVALIQQRPSSSIHHSELDEE